MNILTGIALLSLLRRLRRSDKWTREQLQAHQAGRCRELRDYAFANSPFYRRFHQGLADRPLHELPVLTKELLMENFDDLVTDRAVRLKQVEEHLAALRGDELFLGRYRVNATSGSTGRRGVYLFDSSEWTMVLASFARSYEWAGCRPALGRRTRMASVFSSTPWHISRRIGASYSSWWFPSLRLAAGDPLKSIIRDLNSWQPEILECYPSVARVLAAEQLSGRLRISPRYIFTGAEVLTLETRRLIEDVWGKERLFDVYGVTESGNLATECVRHEGLHLCEDFVIFEVVDRNNRPVPPGTYGDKVLITVLFSRTQPLIRYELSDSVRMAAGPCSCGRPFALITDIQGRMEEMLLFPSVSGGEVTVHPIVFEQVLDTVPTGEWQVVQDKKSLNILLSGTPDGFIDKTLSDRLRQALADQGVVVPEIKVQHVPAIPRGATGKALLIRKITL